MTKIIDCITFFDNNFMFELRYNVLKNYVDYFVILLYVNQNLIIEETQKRLTL